MSKLEVYQRADNRWAWRLTADNGQVIATDGGQGYEHRADCERIAGAIIRGDYTPMPELIEPDPTAWVIIQCPICPALMTGHHGDTMEHGDNGKHIYNPRPLGG